MTDQPDTASEKPVPPHSEKPVPPHSEKPVPPHHETAGAAATRPSSPEQERRQRVEQAAVIADAEPTPDPSTTPAPGSSQSGDDA